MIEPIITETEHSEIKIYGETTQTYEVEPVIELSIEDKINYIYYKQMGVI